MPHLYRTGLCAHVNEAHRQTDTLGLTSVYQTTSPLVHFQLISLSFNKVKNKKQTCNKVRFVQKMLIGQFRGNIQPNSPTVTWLLHQNECLKEDTPSIGATDKPLLGPSVPSLNICTFSLLLEVYAVFLHSFLFSFLWPSLPSHQISLFYPKISFFKFNHQKHIIDIKI